MELSKQQKNDILSDPVTQYTNRFPQAAQDQIVSLGNLQQQFTSLKEQMEKAQLKSKKISRQIGIAKREGQTTEQLMQDIQKQSKAAKLFATQLKSATIEILDYFESQNDTEQTDKKSALPPARIHSEQTDDNERISINQLSEEKTAWNQYVESNPAASLYHRAEWKNLIENVFEHECYFFYASNNEKIVGVLPLVRLNSKLFGDFMVSMPYFNSGGAIANSLSVEKKLMSAANDFAKSIGTSHIEYRDDIKRDLPARTEKVNMILSLTDSETKLWDSFPSKLRSQIKRAQRENTQVKIGGKECLNNFYAVFAQNMRDLGTPVYSKSFFKNILLTFPENSAIVVIYLNNKPVAAAFLLGQKGMLEIPWASTLKSVNHLSINMLLYWVVLKFAITKQYHYFDFGRSSKDAGTYRFKQQWGAQPKQLYWHYWLSDNIEMPQLNPNNPKFNLAIRIWKKIPVFITKWIGPFIVKNLP